jgi:zinc protease
MTGRVPVDRFTLPEAGPPTPVRFPPIARSVLENGLHVWSLRHTAIPLASVALVLDAGAAQDPAGRPGLAGVTAHLVEEGAGGRDAIQMAEEFARLGTHLAVDVGSDVTALGMTAMTRFFAPALRLLGEVVTRPHLSAADLLRVRELRMNRLRQLSRSPATPADRAFVAAVFGAHPYGHGVLGTTASLEVLTLDEVRAFHAVLWRPEAATLIVVGDLDHDAVTAAAAEGLGSWATEPRGADARRAVGAVAPSTSSRVVRLIDRPGAPQSELRIGHTAPARRTPAYPALVTLNAILGGEFSSRINRNLREARGLTYGARTAFDLRRAGGSFICQTSVQTDGTAAAIAEIVRECEAVRLEGAVGADELARAKASLTRGYVRHFEAADELVRAAAQLVAYGLDDDTFDRFVPLVDAVAGEDVVAAGQAFVRPGDFSIVVVGDAARCRGPIEALGREVVMITPEF